MSRRALGLVVAVVAVLATWVAALFALPYSPVAIGTVLAGVCMGPLVLARTNSGRATWFNVAFLMLAVGVFDAYVAHRGAHYKRQYFSDAQGLFTVDDTLGVRPMPALRSTAKMYVDGRLAYDVVYTFDEMGLRISPPERAEMPPDCVLFFGDSYTFGEGLRDEETVSYRTAVRAGGRYRVRNFAFPGYGPHQMLAAIESGFVAAAARCEPRYAVFETEYHHVVRAAGVWSWDKHGPRFVLRPDGRPERAGNFDTDAPAENVLRALEKSGVAAELRKRSMDVGAGDATEADARLYDALVAESRRQLSEIWPRIEFHVVYWDAYEAAGRFPILADPATLDGIVVHRISEILPPSDHPEIDYKLPLDIHPNAHANDLIAAYIVRNVLGLRG